ncbi:MAG: asparagine synthase (glutamine-hydrolyzing) [Cyclobacteriaceae bacterium]|nr:asparagine synthase (glutamine-hydrolyzing) [Cyclobacteriaceae bacterium]
MCGIAGYFYKSGSLISDTAEINEMLKLQQHRGPDDAGVRGFSLRSQHSVEFSMGQTTQSLHAQEGMLGFNRLSIQDLSVNGHQPMCSSDEKVILVFNGEIYNATDYRAELETAGYHFRGHSDTEVILYLYLRYGFDGMIKRLNGMFALVLIDLHQQTLTIARDRFGIKPMYIFERGDCVAFSSEIKSFLALKEFQFVLNVDLLDEYLLFRNTLDQSLYRGVVSLEPGTYRIYKPGLTQTTHKFFTINSYQRHETNETEEQARKRMYERLYESVQGQLISDVKLGCQLSGGVDSSLVTALAKKSTSHNQLETVSVVFNDPRFSEESFIDQVSAQLQVTSHKFLLESSYYLGNLEKATWHFENPLNHPNTIGIFFLSQRAKEFVTVLLSGEGADEVFGGYDRFAWIQHPYHWRYVAQAARRSNGAWMEFCKHYSSEEGRAILSSAFMAPATARLLKPDFKLDRAIDQRKEIFKNLSGSTFDKQVKYEMKTYLPDLLLRQDKMSMAHSIENRVPFLDNELVRDSFSVASQHMIGSKGNTKKILKGIATDIFGESFATRPKQGFGIPLRSYFEDAQFHSYLRESVLPGMRQRDLFNSSHVEKWLDSVSTIPMHQVEALWIMFAFEIWMQQFSRYQHESSIKKLAYPMP